MKTKRFVILLLVLFVLGSLCACGSNDIDVIRDLKSTVFDNFGSQTLKKAAEATLTDIEWSYDNTAVAGDGGLAYNATLSGYSEEYGVDVSLGFTVKYDYRKTNSDALRYRVSVDWVTVEDEYSDDSEDIVYVLDFIYGNTD